MVEQRTFEKFVDAPYNSQSELCGGVVKISFQAMHFLPRSTHYPKTLMEKYGASTNFSNGPCSCSAILKSVLLKWP
jgi:hypothetical protein